MEDQLQLTLKLLRKAWKPEKPGKKLKDLESAAESLSPAASPYLLSKAALCIGADLLLNKADSEAERCLQLACDLAWRGTQDRSLLCMVFYLNTVLVTGDPRLRERLLQLESLLAQPVRWNDPLTDMPSEISKDHAERRDPGISVLENQMLKRVRLCSPCPSWLTEERLGKPCCFFLAFLPRR